MNISQTLFALNPFLYFLQLFCLVQFFDMLYNFFFLRNERRIQKMNQTFKFQYNKHMHYFICADNKHCKLEMWSCALQNQLINLN